MENPDLFPNWPFRLSGLGRPLTEEARADYQLRGGYTDVGWGNDSKAAAQLGLTDEVADIVKSRVANSSAPWRWPASCASNFDWLPDQCHGGNLMASVNDMLLQSAGEEILLFAASPPAWFISFKLYVPRQTTIESTQLTVMPQARRMGVRRDPRLTVRGVRRR